MGDVAEASWMARAHAMVVVVVGLARVSAAPQPLTRILSPRGHRMAPMEPSARHAAEIRSAIVDALRLGPWTVQRLSSVVLVI